MAVVSNDKRKKYQVLKPYQCPNTKHWYESGDTVDLLPCEADILKYSGKVKVFTKTASK